MGGGRTWWMCAASEGYRSAVGRAEVSEVRSEVSSEVNERAKVLTGKREVPVVSVT